MLSTVILLYIFIFNNHKKLTIYIYIYRTLGIYSVEKGEQNSIAFLAPMQCQKCLVRVVYQ